MTLQDLQLTLIMMAFFSTSTVTLLCKIGVASIFLQFMQRLFNNIYISWLARRGILRE
jgi:hypothetical protein